MAISKIYKGVTARDDIVKIYKGSELVYESVPPEPTETLIEFTLPSAQTFSLPAAFKEDELPITITYDDATTVTLTGSGQKSISSKSFEAGARRIIISGEGKYYFNSYLLGMTRNAYITNIVLSNKITRLGTALLAGTTNLTTLTIPSSVVSISAGSINNDSFPSNFETIYLHENNSNFTIINSVLYTKDKSTLICMPPKANVDLITVESETTTILDYAFANNLYLEEVILPNGIESIQYLAFKNCTNLTNINAPASLINLDYEAFYNTAWYNNKADGVVYFGNILYKYKGTAPASTSISIASGTKQILRFAFASQTGITSVTFPSSLEIINEYSFASTGLTSITIPSSVTTIGQSAFQTTKLTSVTIPSGVKRIEDNTFQGTQIGTVSLPSTITYIGNKAFDTKVKRTIYCYATTPPVLYSGSGYIFGQPYSDGGFTIRVPSAVVNTYKSATKWSGYAALISAI